jgi:hypothetical protein
MLQGGKLPEFYQAWLTIILNLLRVTKGRNSIFNCSEWAYGKTNLGVLHIYRRRAWFCKKLSRSIIKKAGLEIKANSLGPHRDLLTQRASTILMIQRLVSMFGVLDFIGMKVGVEVHQCLIMLQSSWDILKNLLFTEGCVEKFVQ